MRELKLPVLLQHANSNLPIVQNHLFNTVSGLTWNCTFQSTFTWVILHWTHNLHENVYTIQKLMNLLHTHTSQWWIPSGFESLSPHSSPRFSCTGVYWSHAILNNKVREIMMLADTTTTRCQVFSGNFGIVTKQQLSFSCYSDKIWVFAGCASWY